MNKSIYKDKISKYNELRELKIAVKIFNRSNKIYKKKIIPLKNFASLISTSR